LTYANCPTAWASKLQTEIALSTTEAEYIALSTAVCEMLPMIALAKEAAKQKLISNVEAPLIRCTMFEDNEGTVQMANVPKMHPRTKHWNIKYYFFSQYVENRMLQVLFIPGEEQIADIFTKPLEESILLPHISGWGT
jgi:hypothetical protein